MEHKVRILEPYELMEQLPDILARTEAMPLVISGNSMSPFLVHGRDTVYLSRITAPLKRGDMILYRRDSGAYVLHRICRVKDDTYTLIGDAHWGVEPGIRPDQVLAIVTAVRRKGKLLRSGSFWWEFFAHAWLACIPLRPRLLRMYSALTRWKRRK